MTVVAAAGGFERPTFDAQAVFRALLRAMAEPGRIETVTVRAAAPGGISAAAAAVLLTLIDHETTIRLDRLGSARDELADWLRFHAGARIVAEREGADFALVAAEAIGALEGWRVGDDAYPDRSATLVVEVEALAADGFLHLSGPGIDGARTLRIEPLPSGFSVAWERNRTLFPRGVDLILTAGDRLAALPRTTRVELSEMRTG